ncbi:MAG: ERF family protein [Lachnospiraceae bacterium]|nr:ERF family protein [Lachnospiraceae bacterium]
MPKEEFKNVWQKLLYVQKNLKAPKGQYNRFGEYHYRSCEDIQEALKPLLGDVGAVLLLNDEIVQQGDRYYIKAAAMFLDVESGESVSNTAYARECDSRPKMDTAQITGSCSSYARKYALNGLFCIDDSRDPDTMDNSGAGQQERKEPPREKKAPRQQVPKEPQQGAQRQQAARRKPQAVSAEHLLMLEDEARRTGTELTKVCGRYGVGSISELTEEQYRRAMSAFSKMDSLPPPAQDEQLELFSGIEGYEGSLPFA